MIFTAGKEGFLRSTRLAGEKRQNAIGVGQLKT